MSDLEERTHPATPRRREEARARGEVARSADLSAAVVLLAGVVSLEIFGGAIFGALAAQLRAALGSLDEVTTTDASVRLVASIGAPALPAAPVFAIMLAAAIAAGVAQAGLLFTLQPLAPRAERLLPAPARLVDPCTVASAVIKLSAVVAVAVLTLWSERAALALAADPISMLGPVAWTLSLRVVVVLLALGMLDYGLRRWRHERGLRMTPQEAREEMRRYEGDPQVRERRRGVQRRLAMERMIHRVDRAAVVMTGGDAAVAIEYAPEAMGVPRVAAKGAGAAAHRILDRARQHRVPEVESAAAAAVYRRIDVGAAVPADLYRAVADAVAIAMSARGRTAGV